MDMEKLNVFMDTKNVDYSTDWNKTMELVDRLCETGGVIIHRGRQRKRAVQFKLRRLLGGQYMAHFKISGSDKYDADPIEYSSPPNDSGQIAICEAAELLLGKDDD